MSDSQWSPSKPLPDQKVQDNVVLYLKVLNSDNPDLFSYCRNAQDTFVEKLLLKIISYCIESLTKKKFLIFNKTEI